MLFENRKQISAQDLMLKYASIEEYRKIEKKPSFEIAKHLKRVDTINGGRIKTPKSSMMRSHFLATDPRSSLRTEIRYADSSNPKIVGDRVVDQYEPRYVKTDGAAFAFQHNIDLAVYLFLHPNNTLSPLKDKNNKAKGKYEFVDTKKRSADKMSTITSFADAMEHAKHLEEGKLVILAKGLGIKGLDKKEPEDIRVDLMEFAMKQPKIYLEKAGTQMTYIEGRILNIIDKGIVKLTTVGSVRRWVWTSGELEGEHILDIQNVTQDAKKSLINFFFSDINKWMNVLNDINNDMGAREKAMRDLEILEAKESKNIVVEDNTRVIGGNLPEHLKTVKEDTFEFPTENSETMKFLSELRTDEKNASWGQVAQFLEAVRTGVVTKENYKDWVKKEFGY